MLVTPVWAPTANAYTERWVGTVRSECLDWLLLVGRGHLEQVLGVYIQHDNRHRPHRALQLEAPDRPARLTVSVRMNEVGCAEVTCSAISRTSTGELHELVYAPHRRLQALGTAGTSHVEPPWRGVPLGGERLAESG